MKKNIFIKIDEFLFQKLDLIKNDSSILKLNEYLNSIDDKDQKIIVQFFTFAIILIPYFFVISLWWGNHKSRMNLEVKSQILEQISALNSNKDLKNTVKSTYLAPNAILGNEDLNNKITNLLSSSRIERTKVNITNFNQISSTSTVTKIEANLRFLNFGSLDFANFARALVDQEKFKIQRINLEKDQNTNLLTGNISIIHLGKNTNY